MTSECFAFCFFCSKTRNGERNHKGDYLEWAGFPPIGRRLQKDAKHFQADCSKGTGRMKSWVLGVCLVVTLLLASSTSLFFASAGTPDEWRTRTIYQLLTDRFAQTQGNTQPCNNLQQYCGGTFRGIINHLPYIKGVYFLPYLRIFVGGGGRHWRTNRFVSTQGWASTRSGYLLSSSTFQRAIMAIGPRTGSPSILTLALLKIWRSFLCTSTRWNCVTHLLPPGFGQYLPQNGYMGPVGRRRQSLRLYLKLLWCTNTPEASMTLNFSFQISPFNMPDHYHTECTITNWDNPIGMWHSPPLPLI